MAFQPAPNCAEAVINCSINSVPAVNRIVFSHAGAYTQSDIDNLAAAVDLAVDDYLIPLFNTAVQYLFTKARGLASAIDLEATNATSASGGGASGTVMSSQQSYVVKLGTGATGRSARGRLYMMPTSIANIVDGRTVSTGYSDAAVDAIADLLTDVLVAGWTGVVLSRQQGGVVLPTALPRTITDVIASNRNIDTQRRRVGK